MTATPEHTTANNESPTDRVHRHIHEKIQAYEEQESTMGEEQKLEKKEEMTEEVKRALRQQSAQAEDVSRAIDVGGGGRVPDAMSKQGNEVRSAIQLFVDAANADLLIPPTHGPTRALYDALITKLESRGVGINDASFLQPLINGLISGGAYVTFSQEGEDPTPFELDLQKVVNVANRSEAEIYLGEIVADIGPQLGITLDKFEEKRILSKKKRLEIIREGSIEAQRMARRMQPQPEVDLYSGERELNRLIIEGTGLSEDDLEDINTEDLVRKGGAKGDREYSLAAVDLLRVINSPDDFYAYYKKLNNIIIQQPELSHIPSEQKRRERAAKDATEHIHKTLQFTTNKIFSQVIESSGEDAWQKLIQDKSRNQFVNLQTVFNNFSEKLGAMYSAESERNQRQRDRDTESGEQMYFYRYGNESQEKWEAKSATERRDKNGRMTKVGGRLVEYTTPSHELQSGSFKELLEDLYLSTESERHLLEAGTNFNFLMNKGVGQNSQSTFFQQATEYAKQSLEARRLDELYKLPHADLVEAAKIQISSYYKKKFAKAGWIKKPEILQGLFSNIDEAMREAKKDMLLSFGDEVPEWAIKRALVHARMHLSLVNLEMHAMSSYAHAPVSLLGKATYRDPLLKDLHVFDTWYDAEQWQMSDMFLKGMAFLPQPNQKWMIDEWDHKDITDEGRDIYEEAFRLGMMSKYGRFAYYDPKNMTPNIFERNPMGAGGMETRLGWRMKYAMFPWLRDMLDNLDDAEKLYLDEEKPRILEYAWKRIENIGINPLKIMRDELLFDTEFLKIKDDGRVENEEHYKHLFRYLYDRYFSEGVGKDGMSITFQNTLHQEGTIAYKDISSADEFWNNVVSPILHRKGRVGKGQDASVAEKQETKQRVEDLQNIVDQALTVLAFERVPMDFVFIENPSRSQNGMTLYDELEEFFVTKWDALDGKSTSEREKIRDEAFDDILYIQQRARTESAKRMNDFVVEQADADPDSQNIQKTVFGKDLDSLNHDRSEIALYENQQNKRGYVVEEDVIRHYLEEKYASDDDRQLRVDAALKVFRELKKRVVLKPEKNIHEINPELTSVRKNMWYKKHKLNPSTMSKAQQAQYEAQMKQELTEDFATYRREGMTTRLMWSQHELIDNEVAMPINDTAYQFLEFKRAGRDMVARTLEGIMFTQENYKAKVAGGELLSALKKYYRKEDTETLHSEVIVKMRSMIKMEDVDWANAMAERVLENAMNVMRINHDAENMLKELEYIAHHKDRSAFSVVVKEGDQYPLRREDRYKMVKDYLHYAQLPKRVKAEDEVWEEVDGYKEEWGDQWAEKFGEDYAWIGEAAGKLADKLLGREDGDIVRQRWKEHSGDGLRDRQVANVAHLIMREGPKYLALLMLVVVILGLVKGYQAAEES